MIDSSTPLCHSLSLAATDTQVSRRPLFSLRAAKALVRMRPALQAWLAAPFFFFYLSVFKVWIFNQILSNLKVILYSQGIILKVRKFIYDSLSWTINNYNRFWSPLWKNKVTTQVEEGEKGSWLPFCPFLETTFNFLATPCLSSFCTAPLQLLKLTHHGRCVILSFFRSVVFLMQKSVSCLPMYLNL